jgi:hypothetical protein
MEVSGQLHTPAALPPVPIGQEYRWASESIWTRWREEKLPDTNGDRTPVVQPLA